LFLSSESGHLGGTLRSPGAARSSIEVVRPLDEPHHVPSEAEVRRVATKLRQYRIPTDVLHLDTGWFETDCRQFRVLCTRFDNPSNDRGSPREYFRISLWQYTYFTRRNKIWDEPLVAASPSGSNRARSVARTRRSTSPIPPPYVGISRSSSICSTWAAL
jgi:hypothetical protein